jgi:uncharacterized protein YdhG (YjbR/CyaY superfamily)
MTRVELIPEDYLVPPRFPLRMDTSGSTASFAAMPATCNTKMLWHALFERGAGMMAKTGYRSVDEYITAQPVPARSVLERVRATIRKALPGAIEGISYQIPVYKLDGRMVLYFAGFQRHYSIYPATERVVGALGNELAGSLHSKATIRLSYVDAIPTRLITRIAKLRAAEATERTIARGAKTAASKKAKPDARRRLAKRRAKKR